MAKRGMSGASNGRGASQSFYYLIMRGGVEPSLSQHFATAGERDGEVSKILSEAEAQKPVEYYEATDMVMCLNIVGGLPEMWAASGAQTSGAQAAAATTDLAPVVEKRVRKRSRDVKPTRLLFKLDWPSRYEGDCRFGMMEMTAEAARSALARVRSFVQEHAEESMLVEKHYFNYSLTWFGFDDALDRYAGRAGKDSFEDLLADAPIATVARLPKLPARAVKYVECACMVVFTGGVFFSAMPSDGDDDVRTPEIPVEMLEQIAGTTMSEMNREAEKEGASFYYIKLDGGVDPVLSTQFANEDERDTEVSEIKESEESYTAGQDSLICLNVGRTGIEVWGSN